MEFIKAKLPQCYLCYSRRLTLVAEIREKPKGETDFGIPLEEYHRSIYQCWDCSVYCNIHNHITEEFYAGKYNKATYGSHFHDEYQRIRGLPREKSDNKQRVERIVNFINHLGLSHGQMHVLDVGSGLGVFPAELKDWGFWCCCIDPDAIAIEHIRRKVDAVHIGTLDDFEIGQRFHLISFVRVLEHLKDPVRYLSQAKAFLTNQSIVYVELPDGESALEYGSVTDKHEFNLEHYTIFNKVSFRVLAQMTGFDCLEVASVREPGGSFTIHGFLRRR